MLPHVLFFHAVLIHRAPEIQELPRSIVYENFVQEPTYHRVAHFSGHHQNDPQSGLNLELRPAELGFVLPR